MSLTTSLEATLPDLIFIKRITSLLNDLTPPSSSSMSISTSDSSLTRSFDPRSLSMSSIWTLTSLALSDDLPQQVLDYRNFRTEVESRVFLVRCATTPKLHPVLWDDRWLTLRWSWRAEMLLSWDSQSEMEYWAEKRCGALLCRPWSPKTPCWMPGGMKIPSSVCVANLLLMCVYVKIDRGIYSSQGDSTYKSFICLLCPVCFKAFEIDAVNNRSWLSARFRSFDLSSQSAPSWVLPLIKRWRNDFKIRDGIYILGNFFETSSLNRCLYIVNHRAHSSPKISPEVSNSLVWKKTTTVICFLVFNNRQRLLIFQCLESLFFTALISC